MKRWTIPCKFGDVEAPFHIYVGAPRKIGHPLQNQASWLSSERNGIIPAGVMESLEKLHQIAMKDNINYEDLCASSLTVEDADEKQKSLEKAAKRKVKNAVGKSGRRPYITACEWGSHGRGQHPAGDSLLEKTPELTAVRAMEVAGTVWPGNDEFSRSARNLFLALALYLGAMADKEPTLSEIFRTIVSDDVTYSICVVMDAQGARISPLCYGLFNLWLNYHSGFRDQVVTLMTSHLIEFAMETPKAKDAYRSMRTGLKSSFFD